MKILFVVPESVRKFILPGRHGVFDAAAPLLAGLTPDAIRTEIIDENVETIDYGTDADAVMITVPFSNRAEHAYRISEEFRRRGKKTVLGGTHLWYFPEEGFSHADAVVSGEAEGVWNDLIEDLRQGRLKKHYQSRKWVSLEDAPLPKYELMKLERYVVAPIQTTKGCPNRCKFCAMWEYQGNRLRHKKIETVVEEMRLLQKHPFRPFDRLPVRIDKQFYFVDLNFCVDASYTKALLEKVADLKISFWAQTSFSSISGKRSWMIKLLAESGCRFLSLGIESLEDEDLVSWNKRTHRQDELAPVFEMLHREGIDFHANLIFGGDNQGADYFQKVREFIERHDILALQPSIMYPFPKTKTHEEFVSGKRFYYYPKHDYPIGYCLLHVPPKMSREEFAEKFVAFLSQVNDPAEVLRRYERVVTRYNTDRQKRTKPMMRGFSLLCLLGACIQSGVDRKTVLKAARAMLSANDVRPIFCIVSAAMLNRLRKDFSRSNILCEFDSDPIRGEAWCDRAERGGGQASAARGS
ncbi:MAG: hypothetical protein AB1640_24540 [bacterium]